MVLSSAALCLVTAMPVLADVVQHGGIRVNFDGALSPKRLPRRGEAPIRVDLEAKFSALEGRPAPQLRRIVIAINRDGRLDRAGLPVCTVGQIQPTNTADALQACGGALVGEGRFSAQVDINGQAPYPSQGKLLAFNGTYEGAPAILAHVYGTNPVPTSFTLPFLIRSTKGTYGTELTATLASSSDSITAISLDLGRDFSADGEHHSYLSAGCPAPKGFPGAVFPLARASFGFGSEGTLSSILNRSCEASG